ncbi:uncharacterized protein LOC128291597 [Gossypium arboreum]|uniref:uncharacterized protein LOC128291597 n=1 Tax=Gossypium arboreum TaxID=29729 RepID=UPI0022F1702F|nr:uncharacterized protein LOC128291597 [Gossypium arboreum]
MKSGACFKCGSLDHFLRDYPKRNEKEVEVALKLSAPIARGRPPRYPESASGSRAVAKDTVKLEARAPTRTYTIRAREEASTLDIITGKANVVTDALNRKSLFTLRAMDTRLALLDDGSILAELKARPTFLQEIYDTQTNDSDLHAKRIQCESGIKLDFQIGPDRCLMFRDRVCIPKDDELIRKILQEAHDSCLSILLGSTKIKDLARTGNR